MPDTRNDPHQAENALAANLVAVYKTGIWRVENFEAFALPILVAVVAFAVIRNIELSFHYQRVREIVFVLQTWNLINKLAQRRNGGASAASLST